ncbi:glycoside hydrolase family 6 protein [Micromonosporaceae bacterium Da 78-11]
MKQRTPTALVAAGLTALALAAAQPLPASATVAGNPLTMTTGLYVNPGSVPGAWVRGHPTDSRAARIKASIAAQPIATWFGNWFTPTIGKAVGAYVGSAKKARKLPVLVAYNLPGRDACGGHSAGGARTAAAYRTWISAFAAGIGARPAVVILEPDAFGDYQCMSAAAIATRNSLIKYAVQQLRQRAPNTWAYLDAGNAGWIDPAVMAGRLADAGVTGVHGFVVNVSNYMSTATSVAYAKKVNTSLARRGGVKPFVVDTSRNGNGSNGKWCNPAGRKLGKTPRLKSDGAEMLLWIKTVGTSDGPCGIAPTTPAGTFSPAIAVRLIAGS